ncbi:MAG: hypothetical protein KDC71_22485 [Acidobacteria bacterium]|nr:hypothetical protein [Acidobacteriota bacterium]
MNYYRLRDIRTPPFAYVVNRDEAIAHCPLCMMPFQDLRCPLQVEIFTTDLANWRQNILGRPLMAEHWLIGDAQFRDQFATLVGEFESEPVNVVSWLSRSPLAFPKELRNLHQAGEIPTFYRMWPKHALELDNQLLSDFPPVTCQECKRSMADVPFDFQLVPESEPVHQFAYLKDIHFEGYDYLFSEEIVAPLQERFPGLLLEQLSSQPNLF